MIHLLTSYFNKVFNVGDEREILSKGNEETKKAFGEVVEVHFLTIREVSITDKVKNFTNIYIF